jgi:CBS domain-containing protein
MKAKDVMTADVISISEKATVLDAARLMIKQRISGLPVVNSEGDLVGVISEGDLLRRTELATQRARHPLVNLLLSPGRLAEEYTQSHGRFVGEVMTTSPRSVTEETDLREIVRILEKRRIRRLPVLRDGRLTGIVTRANVLKAFVEGKPRVSRRMSDSEIKSAILAEMERYIWAPSASIEVEVAEGHVTLSGTIFDDRERSALKVLAENIPGVRKVSDNLVWVEPQTGAVIEADKSAPGTPH